jgi:hypothetical protein
MLKEYNEMKRGQMSELEKLQTDLELEKSEKAKLSETVEETQRRTKQALLRAEVAKLAAPKFADVDVVWKVLNHDGLEVDIETGAVSGVSEALTALEEQYPWMLSKGSKVSQTSITNPDNPQRKVGKTDAQRSAEYFGRNSSDFWEGEGVRTITSEE